MLESSRRPADFLWLLFVACTVLIILSPLSPAPFLSSPLSFSLVYLWSRLNPNVRLSLFGVVQVPSTPRRRPAPYLPYALATFSWALNSSFSAVVGDVLGIATGHFVRQSVPGVADRADLLLQLRLEPGALERRPQLARDAQSAVRSQCRSPADAADTRSSARSSAQRGRRRPSSPSNSRDACV